VSGYLRDGVYLIQTITLWLSAAVPLSSAVRLRLTELDGKKVFGGYAAQVL
jgi:hypothetical protein